MFFQDYKIHVLYIESRKYVIFREIILKMSIDFPLNFQENTFTWFQDTYFVIYNNRGINV